MISGRIPDQKKKPAKQILGQLAIFERWFIDQITHYCNDANCPVVMQISALLLRKQTPKYLGVKSKETGRKREKDEEMGQHGNTW